MKIINEVKYWGQLLLLPIYWLSYLMPREKKIWLFGSTFGRRFADNPKYLFLYVSQRKEEFGIRPIWITHRREIVELLQENGYEAYYYHSLKGIWFALRGKVYIFDNYSKDINFWQSGGAVKINLWHGVGNKQINYDNVFDLVRHPRNLWEKFKYFPRRLSDEKPSHYVLATSLMMSHIFASAFQVPESHVLVEGYPRNDILFEKCYLEERKISKMYEVGGEKTKPYIRNLYMPSERTLIKRIAEWKQEGKLILGYFPTFRQSEEQFFDICDLEEINKFCQENDMRLICKVHPKSVCREAFEAVEYSNIYISEPEADINSFLGQIDLLIVDYSSVYSDYMLLNRPVVAFQYDYEEYMKNTRNSYFDFEEYMPEEKAYDTEGLKKAIQKVLQEDRASKNRQKFCEKLFSNRDGKSCERLVRDVVAILSNTKKY